MSGLADVSSNLQFFEWFVSFGNILTILISVSTLAVFIWKFASFLRKQMKRDAEEIRDIAIGKMDVVDANIAALKNTVLDHNAFIDEKIADIKRVADRTNENLERIDREGTQGVKQLSAFVQSIDQRIEHVDKDVTTVKKQFEEHDKWSSEVTRKYDVNDVEQRKDIDHLKDDFRKLRTEHDEHVKWGEGVAQWGKDIAAKLEKSDIRQEFEMLGLFRDREQKRRHQRREDDDNNNTSSDKGKSSEESQEQ
jgi:hypothetical protein